MNMYHVPDYNLEPPADKFYHHCTHCNEAIYEGEDIYEIEDQPIHKDCISSYIEHFRYIAGEGLE